MVAAVVAAVVEDVLPLWRFPSASAPLFPAAFPLPPLLAVCAAVLLASARFACGAAASDGPEASAGAGPLPVVDVASLLVGFDRDCEESDPPPGALSLPSAWFVEIGVAARRAGGGFGAAPPVETGAGVCTCCKSWLNRTAC